MDHAELIHTVVRTVLQELAHEGVPASQACAPEGLVLKDENAERKVSEEGDFHPLAAAERRRSAKKRLRLIKTNPFDAAAAAVAPPKQMLVPSNEALPVLPSAQHKKQFKKQLKQKKEAEVAALEEQKEKKAAAALEKNEMREQQRKQRQAESASQKKRKQKPQLAQEQQRQSQAQQMQLQENAEELNYVPGEFNEKRLAFVRKVKEMLAAFGNVSPGLRQRIANDKWNASAEKAPDTQNTVINCVN